MLVAIEGIDGSGKKTQADRLRIQAVDEGLRVASFSFPQYGKNPFGVAVGEFLNGEYGDLDEVAPHLAALLYAGDRFAARDDLLDSVRNRDLVICDRYMASNLAHQGAKLAPVERPRFVEWLQEIELGVYDLPSADLTVFLDVPVELATALVLEKEARSYTDAPLDIHEADADYLAACRQTYELLAETDPTTHWVRVACAEGNQLRPPEEIADELWTTVRKRLPT